MDLPRIKICCIQDQAEAHLAIRHGASAIGLVSEMPSGPGPIPESLIADIAAGIPPAIGSFLLTSLTDPGSIIAQQKRCGVNTVQLCDRPGIETCKQLRDQLPGISIIQVIHVTGKAALDTALEVASHVNAILLDSGNPNLKVKELGGTGRTHDWTVSRRIRETVDVPVFLAGGLNPDNVARAIHEVRPFGVDVCTGVRTNGRLDERKLEKFVAAVSSADID
ncbi:MAG: phosphoribosylanthranilate isomerase [Fidelibacterota bacterium]|nr:MAG: phosphoribosylanthranilate isomerase [Candidatus Neomarinimicrobiota bacterium]